jgi:hypothetical protein
MRQLILDTNLLILLTLGVLNPKLILKHKRSQIFTVEDFDLLRVFIESKYEKILLTPNIVTETSNLLAQIGDPEKSTILQKFAEILEKYDETYLQSKMAVNNGYFYKFGLTDSLILAMLNDDLELLTVDSKLHIQAISLGLKSVNFNHLRENSLLS